MRFLCIILVILSVSSTLVAKEPPKSSKPLIKVAVIDTGLEYEYMDQTPLCESGHKDFTKEGMKDIHGHGTNVVGLIVKNASVTNYCIILLKAYGFKKGNSAFMTQALEHAYNVGANVINVSGGGSGFQIGEYQIVKKILDKKITLIVAAGNESMNLDAKCDYYPACYDPRIYVIGNSSRLSNKGKVVDLVINGNNQSAYGHTLSGTSQSTAIFTGEMLKLALTPKKK